MRFFLPPLIAGLVLHAEPSWSQERSLPEGSPGEVPSEKIGDGEQSLDGTGQTLEERMAEEEKIRRSGVPDLPVWSSSDFERLKKGDIIAGQDFFAPVPVDPNAKIDTPPPEELPAPEVEVPVPEIDETVIPSEDMERYFSGPAQNPGGGTAFLVDPQDLLSQQEFRDRDSFLRYHASESGINMFVYLFDERQELPRGISAATVYEDLFSEGGPLAVVFYYLGAPDRTQVHFSSGIRAVISQDEQNRALRAAIQEAFEKSDVAYQLDEFLVELSIRLYWIERELKRSPVPRGARLEREEIVAVGGQPEKDNGPGMGRVLLPALLIVVLGGLILLGRWLLIWRRKYFFPEVECGPLMGAPHAAGVGAVISFSNARLPPSKQRVQAPDYLRRI